MEILFARHGNTFGPSDKVVWVGRETNIPLVERGLEQAAEAAEALRRTGMLPDVIYAATLQRTRQFSEIIAKTLDLAPPILDGRLDEIHYGRWAGLTNDQIEAFGKKAVSEMRAWNKEDVWPENAGWETRKQDMLGRLESFKADRLNKGAFQRPLLVSSNGALRFLPRILLAGEADRPSFKMRTGHLGLLVQGMDGPRIAAWDVPPGEFRI